MGKRLISGCRRQTALQWNLRKPVKDKNSLAPVNNQQFLENNFWGFCQLNKGHKLSWKCCFIGLWLGSSIVWLFSSVLPYATFCIAMCNSGRKGRKHVHNFFQQQNQESILDTPRGSLILEYDFVVFNDSWIKRRSVL